MKIPPLHHPLGIAMQAALLSPLLLAFSSSSCLAGSTPDLLVAGEGFDPVLQTETGGAIYRYDSSGALVGTFNSGGPELDGPSSMTYGSDGNLYVLSGGDTVFRYNGLTGAYVDTFVQSGAGGLSEGKFILFGPDGNLYVACNGEPSTGVGEGGQVLRFNGRTGAFIDTFIPNGAGGSGTHRLSEAMSLAFAGGYLYVGNDGRGVNGGNRAYNVLRFNATNGVYVDTLIPDNDHGLYDPNALVVRLDGNLYVTAEMGTNSDGAILRYDLATGSFIDFFVPDKSGGLIEPYGVIFGPDGNLYVTSADTGEIKRYDGATGAFMDTFVSAHSGGLYDPKAMVFLEPPARPLHISLNGGQVRLQLTAPPGDLFTLEHATNGLSGWVPLDSGDLPTNLIDKTIPFDPGISSAFFRAHRVDSP